ncbi:MAG: hypothetical protein N4A62_13755 [Marinisporobacter sp.]|jgi:hypothetical protein|nr:hypothetical protein [Marinisporobacter sp.]
MEGKNVTVGVLIFFAFTMAGGLLGIFVGYSLCADAEKDAYIEYRQQQMIRESMEKQETTKVDESTENENVENVEELETLPPINLSNLTDIYNALDAWREILVRTANGNLDQKEASNLIYTMSSEIYKRNIPKGFSAYRLKNVITDNGEGKLKELVYSDVMYNGESIAYVKVKENHENKTYEYKLKFIKENNNWCFAAQL